MVRASEHSKVVLDLLAQNLKPLPKALAIIAQIHLIVDAHGNPLAFIISDGIIHAVKVASDLIQ